MGKTVNCNCKSGCRTRRRTCLKHNEPCDENCTCADCHNPLIGTLFAGMPWSSMVIPGTVRYAGSVEIGGSGTASNAINAPMGSLFPASTVALRGHVHEGFEQRGRRTGKVRPPWVVTWCGSENNDLGQGS
jgi:hypothetical protein